jgi:hypothetical protein
MTLLSWVSARLTREGVPHALIGGAALASAGVARSTFDEDLLTTDRRVLTPSFWEPVDIDDVSLIVRRGDHEDPLAGVVRFERSGDRPVDVIVGRHAWQARAVSRATGMSEGPSVVSPADLILLKLYAGGAQDLWDIRELLALPVGDALAREVDAGLADLPSFMREVWVRARAAQ